MARGRMIDKRISKSKKLVALKSDRARVLYFMILPHLDCEGRYSGDPEDIKDDCVPKLRCSTQKIAESLYELQKVGLIMWYEVDKKPYLEFVKFEDFQLGLRRDREAPSKIPNPSSVGVTPTNSRVTPPLSIKFKYKLKEVKEAKEVFLLHFDYRIGEWKGIKQSDIDGWSQAYPACDILIELFQMREWCLANPDKRKKNWRRFITNWLKRTQDRGGTKGLIKDKFAGIKDWYKEKLSEEPSNG